MEPRDGERPPKSAAPSDRGAGAPAAPDAAPPDPDQARLAEALRAFEAGDFLLARRRAEALRATAAGTEVRAGAEELLARMSVDRLSIAFAIGCLVLFLAIAALTIGG